MDILHNIEKSRFEVLGDQEPSVAEYQDRGGVWYFTHTFVPPSQRGQGLAGQLVEHALNTARTLKVKIVPLCSFVVVYLKRHPEFADLIDRPKD